MDDEIDEIESVEKQAEPTQSSFRKIMVEDFSHDEVADLRSPTSVFHDQQDSPPPSRVGAAFATQSGTGSRTGTPLLDQTISAAFRTRIRSKIQTVKENSAKPAYLEDDDLKNRVRHQIDNRHRWRLAIASIIDPDSSVTANTPTSKEAFKFFVQTNFTPQKTPISDSSETVTQESPSQESITKDDDTDSNKLLMKNLFETSSDEFNIYQKSPAFFISRSIRENLVKDTLCVTSAEKTAYGEKTGELRIDIKNRNLKKDSSEKNLIKLENRLYRESRLRWFQTFVYCVYEFFSNWFKHIQPELVSLKRKLIGEKPLLRMKNCAHDEFTRKIENLEDSKFRMRISIDSMQFDDHALANEENTIACKLIDLHQKFDRLITSQQVSNLSAKLETLHNLIVSIESRLKVPDIEENEPNQKRLTKLYSYQRQALRVIDERRRLLKEWRSLLLAMLTYWDELKRRRLSQGFTATTVNLAYNQEPNELDKNEERKALRDSIEKDFQLYVGIKRDMYERELDEYRGKLRAWKQRQRTRRRGSRADGGESVINPEMMKPEPPKIKYDEALIMDRIKEDALLLDGRLPGEPRFTDFRLTFDGELTEEKSLPTEELSRKAEIKRRIYAVEVFVDGRFHAKAGFATLDENFMLKFETDFKIGVTQEPKEIRFDVIEKIASKNSLLAKCFVPAPDVDLQPTETPRLNYVEFNSPHEEQRKIEKNRTIRMSGKLWYDVCWLFDENGKILCPPSALFNRPEIRIDNLNLKNLRLLREESLSYMDPNDAENSEFLATLDTLEEMMQQNSRLQQSFHLDPLIRQFEFCTKDEILSNPRIKLLQKRWRGFLPFKNISIPLSDREIAFFPFADEKTSTSPIQTKKGLEAKRDKALEILSKVREKLMKQAQGDLDRPKIWEDMVIEAESEAFDFGFSLFTPGQNRRPLHPPRKERKKISGTSMNNADIRIIITIMHAFNVPVRSAADSIDGNVHRGSISYQELGDLNYESKVSPFVEACFQRQTCRTNNAEGPQPTWNETLSLQLRSPNYDLSPSSLTMISDNVYLNLFDEIQINHDKRNEPLQFERRWLGSLKIPFSTLYLNSKIEGTFKLNKPPVLLGYEYDSRFFNVGQTSNSSEKTPNTYVTIFLTVDPTLQLPERLPLKCDSLEDERLMVMAKKWELELKTQFPERAIQAYAIDLNVKFVLVTRYLRPIKPPESLLQNISQSEEVMQRLARFISLIPSVPDNIALPGFDDIWCSCSQFLDMLVGDEEEHAILLCNFFLFLGKRAGVILGSGIPEGTTAYVIVWEYTGQEPSIWNPISGERFSVADSFLPLNAIGTIFTNENVYANIQKHEHPNQLSYDVTKSSSWRPLFTRKFPNPGLLSIQTETIEYEAIDEDCVQELQNKLEKHLRESLMKWRKKSRTFFNRACIQQIRKILPRLEKKVGKLQQADVINDLQDVLVAHKMIGFPLNMQFTSIEYVTEAVYATGVHLIEDRKVDFALAVYIHPYPCNVLSVWVYIAALFKEK